MRLRVAFATCCAFPLAIGAVLPTGVHADSITLGEFRNGLSASARYQAIAELCSGRAHDAVRTEMIGHIERLFRPQADTLTEFYDQRYARFQKIRKCPAREFTALEDQYRARTNLLAGLHSAPTEQSETSGGIRAPSADTTTPVSPSMQRDTATASVPPNQPPAPGNSRGTADELYTQGIASFLSPGRAAGLFTQVIAVEPDSVRGYRARAWAHLANNSPKAALPDFDRMLAIEPNDSEAYRGRAWARLQTGQYRLARADFTESIARARNPAEGYAGRALVSLLLGESALARSDFRATMRYQPDFNDAEVYTRSGELLAKPATAERTPETYDPRLRRERRKDPRFGADVSTRLDDWARYRKADALLRKKLNPAPHSADIWLALGVTSYRQIDDDPGVRTMGTARREAKSAFDNAVKADPRSPDILLARAMFAATPGLGNQPDVAIADLTEAISLDPGDSEAYVRRALVRAVSTDPPELERAVEDCETASGLTSGDPAVRELCGFLRSRFAQAQIAQRQRAAYEAKLAEFEDLAWIGIGVILYSVYSANYQNPFVCFDEEGIASTECDPYAPARE
jgi:tetratricopeptide (TPR) repeat protein